MSVVCRHRMPIGIYIDSGSRSGIDFDLDSILGRSQAKRLACACACACFCFLLGGL